MFVVLQGVSSSLEQADSEFPHVTDCTGQVRCGPLETRWRFQWDVKKEGADTIPINGNIFQRQKNSGDRSHRGFSSVAAYSTAFPNFKALHCTAGILKALRSEVFLNNMQQDWNTYKWDLQKKTAKPARGYGESSHFWKFVIKLHRCCAVKVPSSIPHHRDAGDLSWDLKEKGSTKPTMQWIVQSKRDLISNVQDDTPQNYTEAWCRADRQPNDDLCFKRGRIPWLYVSQYTALTDIMGKVGRHSQSHS